MKILIREHTGTHGNLREPNLAWWRITPSFLNYVTTTVNEPAHIYIQRERRRETIQIESIVQFQ